MSVLRTIAWRALGRHVFACSPHVAHALRRGILRLFGARLEGMVKVRRSVRIDRPWNLGAGHLTIIGDHAALRLAAPITIGRRCVVSQLAILTTEAIDPTTGVVRTAPIEIGDDCWVAADALVLPGVRLGAGTVVGARALVDADQPGWCVSVGQPASARRARAFRNIA